MLGFVCFQTKKQSPEKAAVAALALAEKAAFAAFEEVAALEARRSESLSCPGPAGPPVLTPDLSAP